MGALFLPDVANLTLVEAAFAYADAGIPVFPLAQRTKRPIYMGGFNQATVETVQISDWWTAHPEANIGAVPGMVGCIIPDIDTEEAREAWFDLVPVETAATETGGGSGVHPWYRSDQLSRRSHWRLDDQGTPFQDQRLAQLLFRASGGYVVVAPSIHPDTGEPYRLVDPEVPISDLPTDVEAKLLTIPSRAAGGGHPVDSASAQQWFSEWSKPETSPGGKTVLDQRIKNIADAPKDSRNDTLIAEVGVLLNAAYQWEINLEQAREQIRAIYVPHVADTRRATQANREVDHAFDYVATQRHWEGPLEEAIGGVPLRLGKAPTFPAPVTEADRLEARVEDVEGSFLNMRDLATGNVPETDWLVTDVLPAGRLTSVVAEAKVGKSLFLLDLAASLAVGWSFLNHTHRGTVRVLYVDYEMTPQDVSDRIRDMEYDRDEATISLLEQNLKYLQIPPMEPLDTEDGGKLLTRAAEKHEIDLVIVDTLAAAVEGAENDADTFRAARHYTWAPLKRIGCTVVRVDHLGKNLSRGARGSSMKRDDVDLAWELTGSGQMLVLKRAYSRLPSVQDKIMIQRKTGPLRHVRTGSYVWAASAVSLARALIKANIDSKQSHNQVREQAKRANISFSSSDLKAAIAYIEQGMPALGPDMATQVTDLREGAIPPIPPTVGGSPPPSRSRRKIPPPDIESLEIT